MINNCKLCGKEFTPKNKLQIYCSKECRKKTERINFTYIKNIVYTCKYCGKEYHPKSKERNTYCSRECYYADRKPKPKENPKAVCVVCGKDFEGRPNSKYCSDECKKIKDCNRSHERSKNNHDKEIMHRKCKECGKLFIPEYGNKKRLFCSDACSKKNGRRTAKGIRRARKRGVGHESINPIEIFKRDKWKCQLCGIKTPHKLRGTLNDNAPELDHLIPLALGGQHNKVNVQCLCRRCNQKKGATIQGQLKLFG